MLKRTNRYRVTLKLIDEPNIISFLIYDHTPEAAYRRAKDASAVVGRAEIQVFQERE